MSALPVYHSVPTDEKRPISPTVETGEFDPRYVHPAAIGFEGLHVGTPRNTFQVAKDKYTGLSKVKKALVVLAVVWFALAISHQAARLTGGRHHHAHHHASTEFDVKQWRDHSFHRFGHPAFLEDAPPGCNGDREDRAPEEVSFFRILELWLILIHTDTAPPAFLCCYRLPVHQGCREQRCYQDSLR